MRRHFRSDDETAAAGKMYDAELSAARNPYVKFIRAGRHSARGFQSAGIYQSSKLSFFLPFFSAVIDASPFRRSPFCCVSRPPSTLPRPLSIPSHSLRKCMVTNKNDAVSAQRISMLFLSYRRATNERAVCSSSAPFFFQTIVFHSWNRHRPYACRRRRN